MYEEEPRFELNDKQIIALSGCGFSTAIPAYMGEYMLNQVQSDE